MSVSYRLWLCLAALWLALGCGGHEGEFAVVGDQPLEIADFQEYVSEATGEPWQGVSALVTSRLLDQYLDRQLILVAAGRRGLALESHGTSLGPAEVQWLLDELCGPPPEPGQEIIDQEIASRLDATRPARAHVRQVLVDSHEQATIVRERLISGDDFLQVSREMSRAPNAADGGELGFIDHGSLPQEIDDVVFALEAGAFSEPVPGPSGYHVFQVLEIVPSGPPDRTEVELAVRDEFSRQMARDYTSRCIQKLVSEIGIKVYGKNMWFPYTGRYSEDEINA
jgi:parvulin-like peptidyl-prolyl isomerase